MDFTKDDAEKVLQMIYSCCSEDIDTDELHEKILNEWPELGEHEFDKSGVCHLKCV